MGQRFLDYCDLERNIPYTKIRFVLRYSFRVPKEHFVTIVKEFVDLGILVKEGSFKYKVSEEFCRSMKEL